MLLDVKIVRLESVDSTHLYALQLIEDGAIEKSLGSACVIVAEKQTDGIGRCNRKWISAAGNLFTSMVRKNDCGIDLGRLSLAVACAVRETIVEIAAECDNFCSEDLKLHWPNDVYYKNRKVSGILVAVSREYVVISVGINTNLSPDEGLQVNKFYRTCSVKDHMLMTDEVVSNDNVLEKLYKKTEEWIFNLSNIGFSCIRSYWLRNISGICCNITVKNGADSISGYFSDIDSIGRIVLNVGEKNLLISSGDLFMNQEGIITQK